MADPVILQILRALKARAETILVSGGYQTNAGASVHLGVESLTPDLLPAVILSGGLQRAVSPSIGAVTRWELTVTLEAIAALPHDEPAALAEYLRADLLAAVFGPADDTLGGIAGAISLDSTEPRYRRDGGQTVGAVMVLRFEYSSSRTDPYS